MFAVTSPLFEQVSRETDFAEGPSRERCASTLKGGGVFFFFFSAAPVDVVFLAAPADVVRDFAARLGTAPPHSPED